MKENIQSSTIKVPKPVLEDIKIYCKKHGMPVGEWVETAWDFIIKNEFDIYDKEATPALPVRDEQPTQTSQVEGLCLLMKEVISTQQQALLPPPDYMDLKEKAIRSEYETRDLKKELENSKKDIQDLQKELENLKQWQKRARAELERVRDEQPYWGKIEVNIPW